VQYYINQFQLFQEGKMSPARHGRVSKSLKAVGSKALWCFHHMNPFLLSLSQIPPIDAPSQQTEIENRSQLQKARQGSLELQPPGRPGHLLKIYVIV